MDTAELTKGTLARLERIKELKSCTTEEAIEYSVSAGWYLIESQSGIDKERISRGGFNPAEEKL